MKFDNNFLIEVGLQALPEEQKKEFLAQAQEELEVRVGEKMCEGMSDEQLIEFEKLMENDQETIRKMVFELKEDFREDEIYKKLLKKYGVTEGTWEILAEYLSVRWIQKNRPDHKQIVEQVAEELKAEIRSQAPQILNNN